MCWPKKQYKDIHQYFKIYVSQNNDVEQREGQAWAK